MTPTTKHFNERYELAAPARYTLSELRQKMIEYCNEKKISDYPNVHTLLTWLEKGDK